MNYKKLLLVAVTTIVTISLQSAVVLSAILPVHKVLAQTTEAREAEADRLFNQGIQQVGANQLEAALQSFQKALIIYREIKNPKGEGWALASLGLIYFELQDYPKAIDNYQQSLAIAREIKNSKLEAIVQPMLAKAQLRSNSKKAKADRLFEQGIEQYQSNQFRAALQSWEEALKIYREIENREGEGKVLGNLGIAYDISGEYLKAIEYHQQSLKIAQELNNRLVEGQSSGNLGLAYHALGNYPKAIEYHEQSLKIAQELNNRNGEGAALENLGLAYRNLGNYPKAIDYHQQRLAIARDIKDRRGEGQSLGNLGIIYHSLGEYPKAIKYHKQSSEIAKDIENPLGESAALGNIGSAYDELGNYPKAIYYHEQRLAIAQKIKYPLGESQSLGNLGSSYNSLGDYSKAINYYQQSLKIARKIKDPLSEAQLLGNLGVAYRNLGDYSKAIDNQQQSLKIARKIKNRNGKGFALSNLGFTYYKQRKLTLAESNLFEGIKVYESLRGRELKDSEKVSIFETQSNTYKFLQQVLVAQNKSTAALEISERGRGRAFVELLASRLSTNPQEQSPKPPNITEIKQIAKQQNSTLVQYSIIYDEFKIAGKPKTKESQLYIWVIKPTGEVTFRKADLKPLWQKENTTLSELVSTTRTSLGVSDDERSIFDVKVKNPVNEKIQRESLQKLHQLLVKPIADLLPTDPNQRVTFVPQGDLFLVPFPALMDSKDKYLIEKHTILTAPAIQVLELTRSQRQRIKSQQRIPGKSRQNALIVGNPTMPKFNTEYGEPGKQLSSLPGAKREAEAIAPLFNTKVLTGDEATETTIKTKLPEAGVIHFATHGLFDGFQGLQSSIALAPSSQDNGLLTASEMLDIKLNADLVVLSACNTGRGRITGDGVIGLSRSLFLAGTPSVVVSLWSVPDAPTAELMTEFYQNLYQKNLDKAQALRQAMLKMKEQYPKAPRKWAAFTLIGEAE
ncbi:CHAT domain-containing tetratricopeptide repeat protein [Mastigocoleus testarum]|uniref:Fis family transcriptional regulator n=1 Tax=Mastigocoleus testarum BC008 TaxID=371196 RepID=A0A0V7ZGZ0_9CYAN|nr:CHAT domain-containing protein [Mastigocoleus testarum]KST63861.1 Fis family transcriptional regulator [Mastigocoleus testarum BC008]KST64196.1 Fis family transcriptional regulator [Mastigocoleus testarum BC008]